MMVTPSDDTLRLGTHNGHTMVAALKRHRDKPVIFLGDTTLTGGEVAARISQYVQAFEALDAGRSTPGALLALNRPEVLFLPGAGPHQAHRGRGPRGPGPRSCSSSVPARPRPTGVRRCTRSAPSTTTPTCSTMPRS